MLLPGKRAYQNTVSKATQSKVCFGSNAHTPGICLSIQEHVRGNLVYAFFDQLGFSPHIPAPVYSPSAESKPPPPLVCPGNTADHGERS